MLFIVSAVLADFCKAVYTVFLGPEVFDGAWSTNQKSKEISLIQVPRIKTERQTVRLNLI